MKRKIIATAILVASGFSYGGEINFSCYMENIQARCFPTENSMLDIAFGQIDYAERTGLPYVLRMDRVNRMVFVFIGNVDAETLKGMRRQGVALEGIEAVLSSGRLHK
jgi:hypothetical protein